MVEPLAVLISDIHFNIQNLDLCTKALTAAMDKAWDLEVPLIIAGDLNDTKAIIRAEIANRLLEIFRECKSKPYILVGNHDLINEKGVEHSLHFLKPYAIIIGPSDGIYSISPMVLIPYQTNSDTFLDKVKQTPKGRIIICHQGFLGAQMGDYIQDKSSVSPEVVKDYRVFSGHYHRHQTIGTVTYIGSPFTMSYGEANDGPKGCLVLNDDGTYERQLLKLRRHFIREHRCDDLVGHHYLLTAEDFVWLKIKGPASELKKLTKDVILETLNIKSKIRLDLIPDEIQHDNIQKYQNMSQLDILMSLIKDSSETDEQKELLKTLLRELL